MALDSCLTQLEDAHERGETSVSDGLFNSIAAHVPQVRPGMRIAAALDAVFKEQAKCLPVHTADAARPTASSQAPHSAGAPTDELTVEEARVLTRRIREESQHLSLLLAEAHKRKAWRALGYRSWGAYIRNEFGISRSRSYELLVHAEVASSLKDAARLDVLPSITPQAALSVRPRLDLVLEEVSRRAESASNKSDVEAMVLGAVHRARMPRSQSRRRAPATDGSTLRPGLDVARLGATLQYLAGLPPAAECASACAANGIEFPTLGAAARWLAEFITTYEGQHDAGSLHVRAPQMESGAA